jgi:hypothetical protein
MSGKASAKQLNAVHRGTSPVKQVEEEADWQAKAWRIGRMLALFAAVQVGQLGFWIQIGLALMA